MAFRLFLEVIMLPHDALFAFSICLVDSHTVDFPDELTDEHELRVPEKWLRMPGSRHAKAQLLIKAILFFLPRWLQLATSCVEQPPAPRDSRTLLPDQALPVCRRLNSYLAGAQAYVSEQWRLDEDSVDYEDEWGTNIGSFLIDTRRIKCYGNAYFNAAVQEHNDDEADYQDWRAEEGRRQGWDADDVLDDSGSSDDDNDAHISAFLRHDRCLRAGKYGEIGSDDDF